MVRWKKWPGGRDGKNCSSHRALSEYVRKILAPRLWSHLSVSFSYLRSVVPWNNLSRRVLSKNARNFFATNGQRLSVKNSARYIVLFESYSDLRGTGQRIEKQRKWLYLYKAFNKKNESDLRISNNLGCGKWTDAKKLNFKWKSKWTNVRPSEFSWNSDY